MDSDKLVTKMISEPRSETQSHLLLLKQDDASTTALKTILETRYHLTFVANFDQILQLLAAGPVDLILADATLASMNDYAFIKSIRQHPDYAQLPVVLIYDSAASNDIAKGLQAGANDFITQPLDRTIIETRIDLLIQHKRLVDEHQQAVKELESVHAMRNRSLNIASHDLKNPINNIRMAQFLLHNMIKDDDTAHVLLNNIDIAVTTMEEIVSEFLDSAALQGQSPDFKFSGIDVEDVLWDVIMQYNFPARKKNISLRVREVDGKVRADFHRLLQILSNLVSNAIKYSPLNKTVWLSSTIQENYVRISVTDHGPGIPAEERSQLFSEFGKLSTRPTGGENSTGLGLWIVKQLVTLQDGRVGVEFPPEGGSCFWIELPLWKSDSSATDEEIKTSPKFAKMVSTA